MKTKTMTTLHFKKSTYRSPLRLAFFLIPLALTLFALPQMAKAEDGSVGSPGSQNTAEGDGALQSLTANGVRNTAIGFDALFSNTGGGANTALGASALASNTANNNTACGSFALNANTTGDGNTATGIDALMLNINGSTNTANGASALFNNTSGSNNVATGWVALLNNTSGSNNTATGVGALQNNNANANTADGANALSRNTGGIQNTATGFDALFSNTSGNHNTANGFNALSHNTMGVLNTAEGQGALVNNTTGSSNIALGASAGGKLTTGSNNIDIGNGGVAGEAAKIRIGKVGTQNGTFIAGIHGVTVASAVGVVVDVNGHLGTVTSSARLKEAIKPMDNASEAILQLKPVTFRYKRELDPDSVPQFGLVAEQVEKVNPDLVVRGEDGKVMTVRYEAVNAMLLNEFLKEHSKMEEQERKAQQQEARLAKQEATIAQEQKQIEVLTATVQKVSDQITLAKPAPQLVANP
jgi:hypothetical protein